MKIEHDLDINDYNNLLINKFDAQFPTFKYNNFGDIYEDMGNFIKENCTLFSEAQQILRLNLKREGIFWSMSQGYSIELADDYFDPQKSWDMFGAKLINPEMHRNLNPLGRISLKNAIIGFSDKGREHEKVS